MTETNRKYNQKD